MIQKLKKLKKMADHNKYVTSPEFNNRSGGIYDEELKQENLIIKSDRGPISLCASKSGKNKTIGNVWFKLFSR